jgi:hypothetical protein
VFSADPKKTMRRRISGEYGGFCFDGRRRLNTRRFRRSGSVRSAPARLTLIVLTLISVHLLEISTVLLSWL